VSVTQLPEGARAYVLAWLVENQSRLGLHQLKIEAVEEPAATLSAWYKTPAYLLDVTVWDHAYCLDILVMEQASDKLVFSEAGSCENAQGLRVRLSRFAAWLCSHTQVGT
jgi:hypothetical protein